MKKRTKTVYALATSLFLAGCANDGIADATKSIEAIEPEEKTVLTELNAITEQEKALQKIFEDSLAEDNSSSQFSDGSSPVFENIEARTTSLTAIKEANAEMETIQKDLSENDGDKVPKEQVEALTKELGTLTDSLDTYATQYEKSLSEEEAYFKSLAAEDATYETLTDGITKLNEQDAKTKELLQQLNEQFKVLDNQRSEAEKAVQSVNDSSK